MLPKIIISHDVDHLFGRDHWLRDLIYPKLWIKSALKLAGHDISPGTFLARAASPFERERHRIRQVLDFDEAHGVPSTFFFGMSQGLGMSYRPDECASTVRYVTGRGFDVGVHGIAYTTFSDIQNEHDRFAFMFSMTDFGVREHYVRRDESTLEKLAKANYLYDTTVFNKERIELTPPYKVGDMWEFPLHVMDGYTVTDGHLSDGIAATASAIADACELELPYMTFLFHDYLFNGNAFPDQKAWYIWLIEFLNDEGFEFVSYRQAINELESR